MNISKVSYSLIGTAMMVGLFSSCTEDKFENKAKAEAVKYLNGDQLLKAERFANQQTNYDTYNGEAIAYWDSLLIEAKTKEAYIKGKQLILDRANKIFRREDRYSMSLDTILPTDVIEKSRNEYAKYSNAEDFIKARNNAPDDYHYGANNKVTSTHYWNLITMTGKQKEAYQKGIDDTKKELGAK